MPAGAPPAGFFGGLEVLDNASVGSISKLVDMSVACRYLAAQCMVGAFVILAYCQRSLLSSECRRYEKETGSRRLKLLETVTRGGAQVGSLVRSTTIIVAKESFFDNRELWSWDPKLRWRYQS